MSLLQHLNSETVTELTSATTSLLEACKAGDRAGVHHAIQAGADTTVYETSDTNASPAFHLCARGYLDCMICLVTESPVVLNLSRCGNELLLKAAANGHLSLVQWLLLDSSQATQQNAYRLGHATVPPAVSAENNWTFQHAVEHGSLEIARWLVLESGQRIDVAGYDNYAIRQCVDELHRHPTTASVLLEWLLRESGVLRLILAAPRQDWQDKLPAEQKRYIADWRVFDAQLDGMLLPTETRDKCLASPACWTAFSSGLPLTPALVQQLSTTALEPRLRKL